MSIKSVEEVKNNMTREELLTYLSRNCCCSFSDIGGLEYLPHALRLAKKNIETSIKYAELVELAVRDNIIEEPEITCASEGDHYFYIGHKNIKHSIKGDLSHLCFNMFITIVKVHLVDLLEIVEERLEFYSKPINS